MINAVTFLNLSARARPAMERQMRQKSFQKCDHRMGIQIRMVRIQNRMVRIEIFIYLFFFSIIILCKAKDTLIATANTSRYPD